MFKFLKKERGPEYFNMRAAQPVSNSQKIIETMDLKPGQNIADLGSGGGYFALQFAKKVVPNGSVYAVDTNPDFLSYVASQARQNYINNLKTVNIEEGDFQLPDQTRIDVLFSRNVYHHLENRVEYFKKIKLFLNENGKLFILDHKKTIGFSFHAMFKHYTKEETIIFELQKAGYHLNKKYDFLKEQCFLEFVLIR